MRNHLKIIRSTTLNLKRGDFVDLKLILRGISLVWELENGFPKIPVIKKEILPDVVVVQPQHFQAFKLSDEWRDFLQTVVVQQELAH